MKLLKCCRVWTKRGIGCRRPNLVRSPPNQGLVSSVSWLNSVLAGQPALTHPVLVSGSFQPIIWHAWSLLQSALGVEGDGEVYPILGCEQDEQARRLTFAVYLYGSARGIVFLVHIKAAKIIRSPFRTSPITVLFRDHFLTADLANPLLKWFYGSQKPWKMYNCCL